MSQNDKTLIRLKNIKEENMLAAFYTKNPSEFLKMYYFCKENDIPLSLNQFQEDVEGTIEEIIVYFGDEETFPCIDVWIELY